MPASVEQICLTAMQLAGRGDKPSIDDLNQAIRTLQVILSDWASTRDINLWNIAENTLDVPLGDVVQIGDNYYQCYVNHLSTADDKPEIGANWENYWRATKLEDNPLVWSTVNGYTNNRILALQQGAVEDILGVRVQHLGQFSPVIKISAMEFISLDPQVLGIPERLCVQKTANGNAVHLWPLCDEIDAKLFFYTVSWPDYIAVETQMTLADYWIQALYYALGVELGFLYNIGLERLNMLGQKAKVEFEKAQRGNTSEVDECFVKPCY